MQKAFSAWCVGMLLMCSAAAFGQPLSLASSAQPYAAQIVHPAAPPADPNVAPLATLEAERMREQLASVERRSADLEALNSARQTSTTLLLTLITVLLAVIGLVFPIVTYFVSIKPSEKAAKDARAALLGLDRRFAELSQNYRNEQITRAIANLTDADPKVRRAAENEIVSDPFYPFSRAQLSELCAVAATLQEGGSLRLPLLRTIMNHRSPSVMEALVAAFNRVKGSDRTIMMHTLIQYASADDAQSIGALLETLGQLSDREFLDAFSSIARQPAIADVILRDEAIWNQFDVYVWTTAAAQLRSVSYSKDSVKDSVPSRLTKGRHIMLRDSEGRTVGEEMATYVRVYEDGEQVADAHKSDPDFKRLISGV